MKKKVKLPPPCSLSLSLSLSDRRDHPILDCVYTRQWIEITSLVDEYTDG